MTQRAQTFCPASMCPLFAAEGSPWTGQQNSHCLNEKCAWFHKGHCLGGSSAVEQIGDMLDREWTLQLGPVRATKERVEPKTFDCPRAGECQWQIEAGEKLCPPRYALSKGVDPRACGY